jgi:short subunit dehydrogenase-like uncharacterized protein
MDVRNPNVDKGKPAVAVYGASGHTGQFVVKELSRRGFAPIAIVRDEAKLAAGALLDVGLVRRVARIDDQESLARALVGAAAVINCAGPFLDTAKAVISAALRARVHYLDVTAEQASALETFEKFTGPARDAGVVAIPAMGFYGGFCDLLATAAMGDWPRADEIRIGIALDSWRPTLGTRLTSRRNTFRRVVIAREALEPLAEPAPSASWTFAAPFGVQPMTEVPFSETILIHRHLRVSELHTYLSASSLRDIRDPTTPPPVAADESGRSAQTFLVETTVRRGGDVRRASAKGRDIYAFTAPLVVEATERILGERPNRGGVFAPGEFFEAENFLRALGTRHLTLDF